MDSDEPTKALVGELRAMILFRSHLVLVFVVLASYTGRVVAEHGFGLFPVFFGDMAELAWPGQFNLDFMCLLTLSGLWVAHRHRFSATGVLLGLCATFGGALFLSAYLLVVSLQVNGDALALLVGERGDVRARGSVDNFGVRS